MRRKKDTVMGFEMFGGRFLKFEIYKFATWYTLGYYQLTYSS